MDELQEGIIKYQEERIKMNERVGRLAAEKALKRI